ncbi:SusC/RagA family TonB-linked outer membrane protein [Dysgonomonas sp. 511]|uniref:SusC/RagA family TonB-linked outer membrane protein n=1 Tax=Dysgonomonas sp. 511 TaxID=2302930 RepID=UPI0013D3790C|nr:SusC/RagA family TonB-linked outer membrane protein [Dysgonomonas sp. 511]NDV79285.1 SusC/RagA family TonB-linked outer membrane protein [Dysgonomonas sp. 511]
MKLKTLYTILLLFICTAAIAQEMRTVSGVIKDRDGEPIIGVSVVQKGTTNGTITNLDGYYEIKAPLGSTLIFSFVGMKTTEMKVTTKNSKPIGQPATAVKPETPIVPEEKKEPKKTEPEKKKAEPIKVVPTKEGQSLSPYFLVKSNSPKDAWMPLKKTDVTANIAGVIADVCVKQIYINQSKDTLEAIYVFPGSTRAAVYAMAMTIGDRRIDAKIKKKEQARKEYEQAKSEGKSTTLLEQHRPNVFQMNVANILPGDTIVVEMKYTELLEHNAGIYEFIYPTVVGPRYSESGEQWVNQTIDMFENDKKPEFSIKTTIQAGMPIRKISSASHNLAIESDTPDRASVLLSNPKDNEGNRDYILQYELQGGQVESGLLRYEHGDENFFLLMMQPPKKPTSDQIPPREYVFIVDVSGSMHGFPLSVSKELIRNLVSELRPIDRFNVMLFESGNKMLYKESVAATKENIKKAMDVIDKQQGGGSTQLYSAVKNAMSFKETEGFSRTFIIVTDGYVTVEREAFNYIRENLNKANLFPFGIGSSVNRYMIEGLAHAGMGTPYIITNHTQAEAMGKKAIKEISQPVLTDISVDWGDFDVYDVEPVAIPDVFAERPILIYGKYKSPAEGTITVSGIAGNTAYEQKFDIAKARTENNQALRYLWARNQIRYIDDYAQYYEGSINAWRDDYGNHQRSASQIERVTNLGLKYNLLTQYTSFLAVDDVVRAAQPIKKSPTPKPTSTPQSVSAPDFQLDEDNSNLEEVVVVGYGVSRKSTLTCGVSSVSSSELLASQSLQGRVAGLQISQTSGEPGNPSRVRIRGNASIMGSNSPLVVIDGSPVEYADFSQMNMNDVESVSVLKDASATSLYGSRAANGVLIVTSKKAQQRNKMVSLSSSFSIEEPNRLPKLQRRFAQGRPDNGTPTWNTANEPFSWGPDAKSVNAPTYDAYDIFKTGYSFKNYLTLSGKSDKLFHSLKLGNNTQHGFIPESKFAENSIGLKLSSEMSRQFSFSADLDYKNSKGKRLQRGYNMSSIMQGILLTPPTFDNRTYTAGDGSQQAAGNVADNPYWTTKNNPFSDETNRLIANVNLTYKLNNAFSFKYQLNGDYLSNDAKTALNLGSAYMPTGHIMKRDEKFKSLLSRFSVQFDKHWDNFELNSTAGYEYTTSKRSIDRLDGYHLAEAGNYNIQQAGSIIPYEQSFRRHSNAIFGKVNLGYRRMIDVETAMRGEWSSINNTTLLSPSLGMGFNVHELYRSDLLTYMRVHANVSQANKEIPLYIDPVYFNSATYNLNDASQHFESREVVLSDNVKPEQIRHYGIGTNMALWNNRLNIAASWYWKKGKDQLLPTQTTASFVHLENCGTFKTNGFEAEIGAYLIQNRNFSWRSQLIFSRERNRVTNLGGRTLMLAGIEGAVGSYAIEGQPLGVLYGTAYQRDEQGRMIIGDDGFPVESSEHKVLGNPNPDWQLGWGHTLEYKRFSLSALFDYKKGGKMWNGTMSAMNYYGTSQYSADHRNTTNYIFPGVLSNGRINDIPVNFYGNNLSENRWVRYGQYGVGEDGIQDASYIKLREISLGYRIPLNLFKHGGQMKVSVFATNILLYSRYKGVDPETNLTGSSNGFGLDYFNVPGARSIGVLLNWEF